MDVERDRADGAVVGVFQGTAPEAVGDGVVVEGDQRAQVGGGTEVVAGGGEVVLAIEPVTHVETGDGGVGQGRGGVVDADKRQLVVVVTPHDIAANDVLVGILDLLAEEMTGVELRDEGETAPRGVVLQGKADVGEGRFGSSADALVHLHVETQALSGEEGMIQVVERHHGVRPPRAVPQSKEVFFDDVGLPGV